MRASDLARELWPHLQRYVEPMLRRAAAGAGSGGAGAGLSVHGLASAWHTGTLLDSQGPQFLLVDGSRGLTGNLAVASGVTIDGVDISAHAGNANAHHNRDHALVGGTHTASGLTAGQVIRASGATTFAWAQLGHGDLSGIGSNSHATIDSHLGTANIHVDHSAVTLTAGDGLSGGGTIAANRSFAVDGTVVRTSRTLTAGDGLSGGGDLGANRSFAVDSTVVRTSRTLTAGAGLSGGGDLGANRSFDVVAGDGIEIVADAVALTMPGTLTAATSNSRSGSHTHAVTTGPASTLNVATSNAAGSSASLARADHLHTVATSSNPGAAQSILASSATGSLQLVTLASNAAFLSGFAGSGYRVDYGVTEAGKASAEFDNLTVRGRMRVYELLIQQIRATNGSVFVSSSSRAEAVTQSDVWEANGEPLTFGGETATFSATIYTVQTRRAGATESTTNLYHGFLPGDLLRAQRFEMTSNGGFASVRRVDLEVGSVQSLWEYTAALVTGDALALGDDLVRLGSVSNTARQGSVYLTADDSGAPFIDIVDGVARHGDWNTAGRIKARLGRLSGITDAAFGGNLSGYGLYADNVYLRGQIIVTGGNALVTGGAAADVNAGTTTISGGRITTSSITASQIAANTITASQIAAGTITATQIAANTITASQIAANTITASQIAAGTITASQIAANTITGDRIAAGTIAADRLSVTNLAAISATLGQLTLGTGGGIYQGSGSFASPTTGLKMWTDGTVGRLAGYASGAVQWEGATDGRLKAGGGQVVLDADGVQVQAVSGSAVTPAVGSIDRPRQYSLMAGNSLVGALRSFYNTSTKATTAQLYALDPLVDANATKLDLMALAGVVYTLGGASPRLTLEEGSGGVSKIQGEAVDVLWSAYTGSAMLSAYSSGSVLTRVEVDGPDNAIEFTANRVTAKCSLLVDGDTGGVANMVGFTDVTNTAANSTGTGTVKLKGATNRDSAGFVKIYIGTTAYWVPVWSAITG